MTNIQKLSQAGILIAVGVVCPTLFIPVGPAKVFPVQHMINVFAAVILGPAYGVSAAFITSPIRVSIGTGSLLAFPVATLIMSKEAALFGFVIPFGISSFAGAVISVVLIFALKKTPVFGIEFQWKVLNPETLMPASARSSDKS